MLNVVAHQALFVVALAALIGASLRGADLLGARGGARVLAAAALAGGGLVVWTLALGPVKLGGSALALAAGPIAAWAALWVIGRRTGRGTGAAAELAAWWHGLPAWGRVSAGALAGLALGIWIWASRRPGIGGDTIVYHLPEVIEWVHSGVPGQVQLWSYEFPIGFYPMTGEVLLTWFVGMSHTFAPLSLYPVMVGGLFVFSVAWGLRALRVPVLSVALVTATLALLPFVTHGYNYASAGTDIPSIAWLACCGALCVAALREPRMLAPALLAAGLAVGIKTTVAPYVGIALIAAGWHVRHGLWARRGVLLAGFAGALAVAAPWYLRATITHGWPFWPFTTGPKGTGDPVPRFLRGFRPSLLSTLGATLGPQVHSFLRELAGGSVLLLAPLIAVLASRRRIVIVTSVGALLGVFLWTASPYTGRASNPLIDTLTVSTVRYLLPALTVAGLAIALAARESGPRARFAIHLVLVASIVASLYRYLDSSFPLVPELKVVLPAALAGALAAWAWERLRAHNDGTQPLRGAAPAVLARLVRGVARTWPAAVLAGLLATLVLSLTADGWLARAAALGGPGAPALRFFAAQPGFASDTAAISFAPSGFASLAGDRLSHSISLIPPNASCAAVRARLDGGWIVLQPGAQAAGLTSPFTAARCMRGLKPVYRDRGFDFYAPRGATATVVRPPARVAP